MMPSVGEKPPSTAAASELFMEVPEQKPFIGANDYTNVNGLPQSSTPQQQSAPSPYSSYGAHAAVAAANLQPYFATPYHQQFATPQLGYGAAQSAAFLYAPPSSSPESRCFPRNQKSLSLSPPQSKIMVKKAVIFVCDYIPT